MQGGTYVYDPHAHPHWTPLPTSAGFMGFGAARQMAAGRTGMPALLADFKAQVYKMTAAVVQDLGSSFSVVFSWGAKASAQEWASHMNGYADSTVATLSRVRDGLPFWQRHPQKAKELLEQAKVFVNKEAKQYTKAAAYLLTIDSILRQAMNVTAEKAGVVAAQVTSKVAEGAAKGAAKGGIGFFIFVGIAGVWIYSKVKK